jgi:hypothetical protein
MRLRINCETCDARKINEENYKQFSQIRIYTEEMIVDDRSKEILNRLPFSIKAEEVRSKDVGEECGKPTQTMNGIYEISPNSTVAEGTSITVNGMLKIAPGSQEVLQKYNRITVNGVILCPKSISAILPLPGLSMNGMTKVYPDEYVLMDNRYRLDKYFPIRAPRDSGYYAATFIFDADKETDFNQLAEKNVKFSTEKVYIRKSHLEAGLPLFNIEAKIEEVPDECSIIVEDDNELTENMINVNGGNLYIIGNLLITNENRAALERIQKLVVDGEVRIDGDCLSRFNSLNAAYKNLVVRKGVVMNDMAMATIDKDTLEAAVDGISIIDCALLKIDKDVPPELIRERLKIRDCAKVSCSEEQKGAVSSVSSDVAFIGTGGVMSILGSIFSGNAPDSVGEEHSDFGEETKYINAEYYEL